DYLEGEDRMIFGGRESDIDALIGEIASAPNRIIVICGRSGVGKTSLIKAAIVPKLNADKRRVGIYVRSGTNPAASVATAVASGSGFRDADTVGASLLENLTRVYSQDKRNQVIFVDQLEEAFFKCSPAILGDFFRQVGACASDSQLGATFVFSLREDYLGTLTEYSADTWGLTLAVWR